MCSETWKLVEIIISNKDRKVAPKSHVFFLRAQENVMVSLMLSYFWLWFQIQINIVGFSFDSFNCSNNVMAPKKNFLVKEYISFQRKNLWKIRILDGKNKA